jgi:Na+/phosphate symporter
VIDFLFLQVIGGVFLLLYGIRLTGQGFELAFSTALSRAWSAAARARVRRRAGGTALQSSGRSSPAHSFRASRRFR